MYYTYSGSETPNNSNIHIMNNFAGNIEAPPILMKGITPKLGNEIVPNNGKLGKSIVGSGSPGNGIVMLKSLKTLIGTLIKAPTIFRPANSTTSRINISRLPTPIRKLAMRNHI